MPERKSRPTKSKPAGKRARGSRPKKRTRGIGVRKRASSARAKTTRAGKPARKAPAKKTRGKKAPGKKAAVRKAKTPPRNSTRRPAARVTRRRAGFDVATAEATRGLGPDSGGQSGDTEGLSRYEVADSESVEELLEEGQAYEAGIIGGVENAPDADEDEVRTRQVPEDDVPPEYLDED